MKDAIIVQQASGQCVPMLEKTVYNHLMYAKRHNMDYLAYFGEIQPDRWHPSWCKLVLILDELKRGREIVFWLDADSAIVKMDVDLRNALPKEMEQAIAVVECERPCKHLNIGVMYIRNGKKVRELFEKILSIGPVIFPTVHPWHEQLILMNLVSSHEYDNIIAKIDFKWNSTSSLSNDTTEPVVKAWHGEGDLVQRLEKMRNYLQ